MQLSVGMICDIALVCLLLFVAFRGRQQGFLAGLAGLVGAVAAVIGGVWAARTWAPPLYQNHIGTAIAAKVGEVITNQGDNAPALLAQYAAFLPEETRTRIAAALQNATAAANSDIARQVADALQPLLEPALQMLLFLVVCFVIRAVFRLIIGLCHAFNSLPVLGGLNQILGFAFGFVNGILDCWLVCLALWAATAITAGRLPWLTGTTLSGSMLYSFFSQLNPLLVHY
ncbi:MAG: CvpA family protein [Gemmiger sp.]|nr:CvpA family protein [Gemmiger sp.]